MFTQPYCANSLLELVSLSVNGISPTSTAQKMGQEAVAVFAFMNFCGHVIENDS
jgi:hypothetical protein